MTQVKAGLPRAGVFGKETARLKVSVRKISEVTGFSPATVSHALNHRKGVNAETAEKILLAAQELGYYGEKRINRVKFVIIKKQGFVVEDTPFFPQMITGVEKEARLRGLDVTLTHLDLKSPSFQDQLKELEQDRSSAYILLGTELTREDAPSIRDFTTPVVVVDYWDPELPYDGIMINNVDSAILAGQYLIDHGHRSIGYLKGSLRIRPFVSRQVGFCEALRSAGLTLEKRFEVPLTPTMDGAYADMRMYLAGQKELPGAFFADNDMIALGAMKAMWEAGIRIPEDVSVIGFDDLPYSSISNPPLTTMRVPKQMMGRLAVRRIVSKIEKPEEPRIKIQVCTELVARESVRNAGA